MGEWWNVNKVVKVYSGHADSAQRKGDIYPQAGLEVIDEYKGSVQFNPEDLKFEGDGKFVDIPNPSYPGYWVRLADLSKDPYEPFPDPVPNPEDPLPVPEPVPSDPGSPSNEALGAAVRLVANFIRKELLGR